MCAANFLPTPPALSTAPDLLFPLDVPAWSLFYELVANAFFAALATRLVARSLAVIVGVGLLALVLMAWHGVVLGGRGYWDNTIAAPARIAFSFFLGVFLNRYATGDSRDGNLYLLFLLVLCGALMIFDPADYAQLYSLVVIVLIWLGSFSWPRAYGFPVPGAGLRSSPAHLLRHLGPSHAAHPPFGRRGPSCDRYLMERARPAVHPGDIHPNHSGLGIRPLCLRQEYPGPAAAMAFSSARPRGRDTVLAGFQFEEIGWLLEPTPLAPSPALAFLRSAGRRSGLPSGRGPRSDCR